MPDNQREFTLPQTLENPSRSISLRVTPSSTGCWRVQDAARVEPGSDLERYRVE